MALNDTLSFGKAFKRLLTESKLTNTSAGKQLGVSDVSVYKMTTDANSPSIDKALKYLDCVGYTLAVVKQGENLPESSILLHQAKEQ